MSRKGGLCQPTTDGSKNSSRLSSTIAAGGPTSPKPKQSFSANGPHTRAISLAALTQTLEIQVCLLLNRLTIPPHSR